MTITQTKAIDLLSTDLDYVDTLTDFDNLSDTHRQMFGHYLTLNNKQRKSLKQLDNIFVNLIGYLQSNLYKLDLSQDYSHLLTNVIDTIQGCKRCRIHLRVCLYQILAMSVKIELLAKMYLTSQTGAKLDSKSTGVIKYVTASV